MGLWWKWKCKGHVCRVTEQTIMNLSHLKTSYTYIHTHTAILFGTLDTKGRYVAMIMIKGELKGTFFLQKG
jgi:hypothetical protein